MTPTPVADSDNDGLNDILEIQFGTNPLDPDTDDDGCLDGREPVELNDNEQLGGRRDPLNFWDFMDVPTGTQLLRNRLVSGGDIAAVVARFGATDSGPGSFNRDSDPLSTPNALTGSIRENYHPAYDRGGTISGGDPWDLLEADGVISGGDIARVVIQFGHNCRPLP